MDNWNASDEDFTDCRGVRFQLTDRAEVVPKGIICLLSALRFHGLTTQAPFEVWLAIENKAIAPKLDYPPLRIVRFSGAALTEGVWMA